MSRTLRVIIAEDRMRVDIEAGADCAETEDMSRAILEILGVRIDGVENAAAPRPAQVEADPTKMRARHGG